MKFGVIVGRVALGGKFLLFDVGYRLWYRVVIRMFFEGDKVDDCEIGFI